MESAMIKVFVNYLFKMVNLLLRKGLVGIKSLKDLLNSIERNKNVSKELDYSIILYDYFKNINHEQLEEISMQIFENFSSNLCSKNEKLIKILNRIKCKTLKQSLKRIKDNGLYQKSVHKTILTTQERKEIDELKDCTFQPKITMHDYQNSITKEIYSRLYEDKDKRKSLSELRERLEISKQNINCTFSPKIKKLNYSNKSILNKSFPERLTDYNNTQVATKENNLKEDEDRMNKECTFIPNINSSIQFKFVKPFGERLYEDYIRRSKNHSVLQSMREKEILSFPDGSDSRIFDNSNSTRHIDLFNKSKIKRRKIAELRKLIDKEDNLTFHPSINTNIIVSSSFHERNNLLLHMKNNFSNEKSLKTEPFQQKFNKNCDENMIIERLYSKDISKVREKVFSPKENKYNFNEDLRPHMHRLDKEIKRKKNHSNNKHIYNHQSDPYLSQDSDVALNETNNF